jgi:hypothetical protein
MRAAYLSAVAPQVFLNTRALWRVRFRWPEFHYSAFALLVVTNHELPEQIVERFMSKAS